ncbi:MAG: aldo/keto reductase [Chloroflexi bacterium]|nr:aldo/keto reductase [Chloroflexota bacterium]
MVNNRRIGNTSVQVSEVGLGTVSFGGLYTPTTQDMATEAVRTCLDNGVNYFDTAPLYGHGRSEERLGVALKGVPRDSFVVSSKVGRVLDPISDEENARRKDVLAVNPAPFQARDDYSADGIKRSFESSLERLGLDRIDIVYIHYGDITDAHNRQILDESYPVLEDYRSQGLLTAIGMGVDEVPPLLFLMERADFDVFMLAFRYNPLDQQALPELFPRCAEKNVSTVIAAPYTGGILAMDDLSNGAKYMYYDAKPDVIARVQRMKDVCAHHNVPLRAVALQFGLNHPVVASTVPGGRNGKEVKDNVRNVEMDIPAALWDELVSEGLLPKDTPRG